MPTSDQKIHCVIVDDHLLLLQLLAGALRSVPGLVVAGTATSVTEAEAIAVLKRIDLMIVDPGLGSADGVDVLRTVVARHPAVKCIVLSGAATDFVCPADVMPSVVAVVDKSHACDTLLSEIKRAVGLGADDTPAHLTAADIKARLTGREFELFNVLGEGLSNKEVGQRFGISTRTVETHRKAISRKLGCSGAALLRLATVQHSRGGFLFEPGSAREADPSTAAGKPR